MARKILLADDSVTAQNMGRKILIDAGYDVITVNNGSAALKKIAEQKPDLIVLDVYMPGYSGLEVCQRVKDDEDTARIPVLLTVGKLEPFKPEEARKARADAYIVKPFEASELLVALTKLEDKVVPPPGPGKAGRAGKNAGAEQSFGDAESGWKKRLRFPTPASKAAAQAPPDENPAETKSKPAAAALPNDITSEEIAAITAAAAQVSQPKQEPAQFQVRSAESEITEVAPERAWPKEEPAHTSEHAAEASASSAELPPVTFATAMEAQGEFVSPHAEAGTGEPVGQVSQGEIAGQEVAPNPAASATAEVKAEEVQASNVGGSAEVSPAACESVVSRASEIAPTPTDADVMAALQTLSPPNGDGSAQPAGAGSSESQGAETKIEDKKVEDNPMAAVLAAVASTQMAAVPSGPRWVAESVAVDAEEGTLILEREMEKAYAAFAAADGARASFAGATTESPAMGSAESSTTVAPSERPHEASLSAASGVGVVSPSQAPVSESEREDPQSGSAAASGSEVIAARTEVVDRQDEVARPASEEKSAPESAQQDEDKDQDKDKNRDHEYSPSPTVQDEAAGISASEQPAEAVAVAVGAAVTAVAESALPEVQAHAESVEQPEMAASAAAAAAGPGGESNSTAAALSAHTPVPEVPAGRHADRYEETDPKVDSELNAATAAAWANWRQIRDTVVAASSQVADAAAATFKDIRHEPPAKPEREADAAGQDGSSSAASGAPGSSGAEANAIASIVESVLSELKPKLVEEIAKKMAADKKADKKKE